MKMRRSFEAWLMLMLSLPKGIVSFVLIVAGLSAGLPLFIIFIGVPLLAFTFLVTRRMMHAERNYAQAWLLGERISPELSNSMDVHQTPSGLRGMLSVFTEGSSYRAIVYSLFQLPVGILAFTLAIVLPVTAFGVTLSPLAYELSMTWFGFDLFANDLQLNFWYFELTSEERAWTSGGIGLLLLLATPALLRGLAQLYATWVIGIAGRASLAPRPQEDSVRHQPVAPMV